MREGEENGRRGGEEESEYYSLSRSHTMRLIVKPNRYPLTCASGFCLDRLSCDLFTRLPGPAWTG